MTRFRTAAALAVAMLVVAGAAGAADDGGETLPGGWTHAEINYTGADGLPHTLILDRGRVQSVAPTALVLKERDGAVVTVAVSAATRVRVNGRSATIDRVRVGMTAVTRRVDGGAAKLVRAVRTR